VCAYYDIFFVCVIRYGCWGGGIFFCESGGVGGILSFLGCVVDGVFLSIL